MAAVNPILTRFTDNGQFEDLLDRVGLGINEKAQFTTDGFTDISLLVKHFSYDVKAFKSHLQSLNKTFANAALARRMYFNPIHWEFSTTLTIQSTHSILSQISCLSRLT